MSPEHKRALLSAAHTYIMADINSSQAVIDLREGQLVAFVDFLLAAERDACAKIADSRSDISRIAEQVAFAIRARGTP